LIDRILSQDIEGRLISDASEIVPGVDDLRAVDVLGRFAALYYFGVGQGGAYSADCAIALRVSPGGWQETTGGGIFGGGLDVPFRPSRQRSGGHFVSTFIVAGMDLPDDLNNLVLVRGAGGFAIPEVRSIGVRSDREDRTVPIESPSGAFVVVVLGEGSAELQGQDERGREVGPPATLPLRPRRLGPRQL
jgi:hypothetical protein